MKQKFKTTFTIKTKNKPIYYNISFSNKKLFEQHQRLDHFQDIKTIIIFSCKSIDNKIDESDIKLYSTKDSKNFINYEDNKI